ncbi:MAG TPA: GNAT family N-acetyltransferase [Pyrinomonadaceae bacterium]|jgi:ribosomal protein S18 acetylase RimI-like enzyme
MNPTFTLADATDTEQLVELMREFYAFDHIAFDEAAARRALAQILGDRRFGLVYLIRAGAETVGYLVLTFGFSLEFHGRDAFVDELYLRESFRGRGIGRASIEFAAGVCRDARITALHLEVERANAHALGLYRRTGFRDHDRYLLTKWLS